MTRLSVNMFCLETLQLQTNRRRKGGGAEKQLPAKQRNFREISHKNSVLVPECFTNFSSNVQCLLKPIQIFTSLTVKFHVTP